MVKKYEMIFWAKIYFIDANCPLIEQIIFFHDHAIISLTIILSFLFLRLIDLTSNSYLNLNLIENQSVEIVWTILPSIFLLLIAAPRLRLLYLIEETFTPDIRVKVYGYQWYWSYLYIDFELQLDCFIERDPSFKSEFRILETDTFLFLPFNTFVSLLVSRNDVIHSWTVQRLGVKTDAIPGRLNQINLFFLRPGLFFGQCSEICGINHRFIPISLIITRIDLFIIYLNYF